MAFKSTQTVIFLITMAVGSDAAGEIASLQKELLSTLKKSHRLFAMRLYFIVISTLLLVITVGVAGISMNALTPGSGSTFISSLIGGAIISPLFFWGLRKHVLFLRWSGPVLQAMETQALNSDIFVDLPTYINKLFDATYSGTVWGTFDQAPARMGENFHKREKKFEFVYIVILGVFCAFTTWTWITTWSKESGGVIFLIFECAALGVIATFALLQYKWATGVQIWGGYYEALDRWGQSLLEGDAGRGAKSGWRGRI
ncbi:MAG TPA: hypothetical protein VKK79_05555 [Candidatus Lokiarchaeia archaeon]|nr:hypothetical protein [Candidatus Lokiarchaeia archaeon]